MTRRVPPPHAGGGLHHAGAASDQCREPALTGLAERVEPGQPFWKVAFKIFLVLVFLYFFLGGMAMMSSGLKALGKNPEYNAWKTKKDALRKARETREAAAGGAPAAGAAREEGGTDAEEQRLGPAPPEYRPVVYGVFEYADHPLVGLFLGVLATSVFQSSSFTTSFAVSLVVTTPLTLYQAIPIIMGANIGTSVTNAGVSFTHIRRRDEFERAYGAAIVHDFFNVLTVMVLFPTELIVRHATGKGLLERLSTMMAEGFYTGTPVGQKPTNFIETAVSPVTEGMRALLEDGLWLSHDVANIVLAVLGVVFLFAALILLTKMLRSLVLKRIERFFDRVLFRNAVIAFVVGLVLTSIVQSSSVTTSLLVPLTGAGLLTIYQVFPYTLGANIGTTVTALIASLAAGGDTAVEARTGVALAFSHMLFNIIGTTIWYPLRFVPIETARWYARHAARAKRWAFLYVGIVFFVLPACVLGVYWLLK